MKKLNNLFIMIALLGAQQTFAQAPKEFTLTGTLSGKRADSVTLSYRDTQKKYVTTTVPVLNQQFKITGKVAEPGMASVFFKTTGETIAREEQQDRRLAFYLEPNALTLSGDPYKIETLKISGSKTQTEYEELTKATTVVRLEEQPVIDELRNEKDHEKQAEIREKLTPFNNRIKKITYDFFLTHPNSYVTVDQMKYYVSNLKMDSTKRVYEGLNEQMKATEGGKYLAAEIRKIEAGLPGSMATDFTATDINGKSLSLSNFKGKYVIIDFWASWCVPCRKGNPHMIELYKTYKDKGLEIIGISDDDRKPELWKAAVAKDNIGIWKHVLRGLDLSLAMKQLPNPTDIDQKYGIHSLPTKILIDPAGKIIGRYGDSVGGTDEELDQMLASVFK